MYWVTPRYLAGDDGALVEHVSTALVGAGWSCWATSRHTLFLSSPDQLRGGQWLLPEPQLMLDGLPVAWQIFARDDPSSALAVWNAYFTINTPHEALAAFVLALHAIPDPATADHQPAGVMEALIRYGWACDPTEPQTTAWAPKLQACLTLRPLPDAIDDHDPRPDLPGWQAWAEPADRAPHQWCAAFSHSTPHRLVAAFAAELADPAPVQRHTLPNGTDGQLTLTLPN